MKLRCASLAAILLVSSCKPAPVPEQAPAPPDPKANTVTPVAADWILRSLGKQGAVPADIRVTLTIADSRFTGRAGCNSYFAAIEAKGENVAVGPVGSTKMACAEPIMRVESQFLETLSKVDKIEFQPGRLLLKYGTGDQRDALEFAPGP